MNNLLCPDFSKSGSFHLQGDYFSEVFQYVQLVFRLCDETRGEECAADDEIIKFFQTHDKLQFMFTDTSIMKSEPKTRESVI